MKKAFLVFNILIITLLITSCGEGDTPTPAETATTKLVSNPWKVDKITDLNGNVINNAALPADAKALFGINIQFKDDKTVRALDAVSKSVINGGTWQFLNNEKTLDINVSLLKGEFPINELSRSKMILKYKVIYQGLTFDVLLELVPAV